MMRPYSWNLGTGLDLERGALRRKDRPGALIGGMNYEARPEGYRRIDGYERFDGRPSPSDRTGDSPGDEITGPETRRREIRQVPGVGNILAY